MPTVRTVFLVCESQLLGDRLADRISKLVGITFVGRSDTRDDALRRIAAENPKVVIVDIHLAASSGMDVLRSVKRFKYPPLVVALSTSSERQYSEQCIREGADCSICLPEEIDKLTEFLEGAI